MSFKIEKPRVFSPSELQSIQTGFKAGAFKIPLYQRLYSWGNKEIQKLLTDIESAAITIPPEDYYIGNITLNYNSRSKCFDIIDGQQRLTTLWLIGLVFKLKGFVEWNSFLLRNGVPVLGFTARDADTIFLRKMADMDTIKGLSFLDKADVNDVMIAAINTIDLFLSGKNSEVLADLSRYMLRNVNMVAIFLPDGIDLNKYFEDMNNRGVQLESHHILKALLLKEIPEPFHRGYSEVWDAVAQMNQFVEYGLPGTVKENRIKLANGKIPESYFAGNDDKDAKISLEDLINDGVDPKFKELENQDDRDLIANKVGSIINFPEFLLHALKLYLGEGQNTHIILEDKRLLEGFERHFPFREADKFIRYLFQCRLVYDRCVIKSVETSDGFRWEIRQIRADMANDIFIREKHFREVVQVQAMLNVGTSLPVWFTRTMVFLMEKDRDSLELLTFLEDVDRSIGKGFLGNSSIESLLSKGTGTGRYWFYNLDYLLWRKWTEKPKFLPIADIDRPDDRIRGFQFRDSRSVEHIHPQHPTAETWPGPEVGEITAEKLISLKDRFGNLALISVGSNSSYNNQLPSLKKSDFRNRCDKYGIESLKLVFAYHYADWTVANMEQHEGGNV